MKTDFLENNHVVHVAPSSLVAAAEDYCNAGVACDIVSLMNHSGAVFMINTMANGSGGQASVYVYSCDDTTPTTTTPIAFKYRRITAADTQDNVSSATSAGFATSTGANMIYVVEVDAADLDDGHDYCQLVLTEKTNQAVDGGIVGFLTGPRYAGDTTTQVT